MHLVEISIFSLNHVIVRLAKTMNNLLKHFSMLEIDLFYFWMEAVTMEELFAYIFENLQKIWFKRSIYLSSA